MKPKWTIFELAITTNHIFASYCYESGHAEKVSYQTEFRIGLCHERKNENQSKYEVRFFRHKFLMRIPGFIRFIPKAFGIYPEKFWDSTRKMVYCWQTKNKFSNELRCTKFEYILKTLKFDQVYFYNKLIFSIMPIEFVPKQIRIGINIFCTFQQPLLFYRHNKKSL